MTVANNTTDLRYGVTGELGCKAPCRGATITNITLEGEQTANGIAFVEYDIALVNGQTDTTENGVYIVSTSAWTRAVWFDDELDVLPGTLVVTAGEGTLYPNTIFETICADNPIVFGTSTITFQVKASGTNTGDKAVVLTGPITGTSSELVLGTLTIPTVITDNSVTNTKLAQVATGTFKARITASTGNSEDLTGTQATTLLNNFVGDSGSGGTKGLVPAPAAGDAAAEKFLKAGGTWEFVPGSGQATETTLGTAKIATQAITNAGTDDLTIVTPLTLKTSVFNSRELISTGVASNTAVIDFTNLSNQYSEYIIELINVLPVNDNVYLSCRFSIDNGSSFITSNYIGGKTIGSNIDNPVGSTSNTDRLDITPTNAGFGVDNTSTNGVDATLVLINPSSTSSYKSLNDRGGYDNNSGNYTYFVGSGRYEGATTAINAIRFLFNTGNIASGTFKLYGIK